MEFAWSLRGYEIYDVRKHPRYTKQSFSQIEKVPVLYYLFFLYVSNTVIST